LLPLRVSNQPYKWEIAEALIKAHQVLPEFKDPGPAFDAKACMKDKKMLTIPLTMANPFNAEIAKALALPDVRERLIGLGYEPAHNTPQDFAALIRNDLDRFGKVIREAGIKGD